MLQTGSTQVNVARHLGVSQSVISRLWNRYLNTGEVVDRPRSGRPRMTTRRQDLIITNHAQRNNTQSATRLRQHLQRVAGVQVSAQTIRNRLHDAQVNAFRPRIVLPLTPRHRQARSAWCRIHQRWTRRQWGDVMFSDESRFELDFNDGRVRVWRHRGDRYHPDNMIAHHRFGRGSVMVWGGITSTGRTPLHVCQGNVNGVYYRDNIIDPLVVPFARRHGPGFILQDDNAPAHRANVVRNHLQRRQINSLPWPSMSPDLSPIENLWDFLGRRVRDVVPAPQNLQQLALVLQQEWAAVPQATIRQHINSMRRRCTACLTVNGGPTRY